MARLFQNQSSFKTIYCWINSFIFSLELISCLRQKGKRQRFKETIEKFNIGRIIS